MSSSLKPTPGHRACSSRQGAADPSYSETIDFNLDAIEPSLAGPKRPQDRVPLKSAKQGFAQALPGMMVAKGKSGGSGGGTAVAAPPQAAVEHGSVVIAAITSCTNTSNPSVMIGAGLVAKKAVEKGLTRKPWVKTSLAPGSKVVTDYLKQAGLDVYLDQLGFNLVGYGCTTCIGNSGPLPDDVSAAIDADGLVVASVLSGNRNFEGRVQQQVRANYLASPPLVVAYALAGTMNLDLTTEPLGTGKDGKPVYLQGHLAERTRASGNDDGGGEVRAFRRSSTPTCSAATSAGSSSMCPRATASPGTNDSTYVRNPPFLEGVTMEPAPLTNIGGARVLALLGDSITTDHISPAGSIKKDSPAGKYLIAHGVQPTDFNSYGARRGNHEVMMRGTFANMRLRNQLAPGTEGGFTTYLPGGEVMPIYDAAMKYKEAGVPLVVLAGKEYGSGSSRDWAAKGTLLLGVKAVIAESFERIHRSNLVNMGVLPLQFPAGAVAVDPGPDRPRVVRGDRRGRRPAARRPGDRAREGRCGQGGRVQRARAHRHARGTRGVQARRHPALRAEAAGEEVVASRLRAGRRTSGLKAVATDMLTSATIKARALELGFDLCGIAPAVSYPELAFFREWIDRGYAGEMGYLAPVRRQTRRRPRASCRRPAPSSSRRPSTTPIARTRPSAPTPVVRTSRATRGATTTTTSSAHRLDALVAWMREASPEPFEARAYVDTGPVQERVYAQHAGIGWIGKNTCVINPELGSWIFLSEIICSLPLEADEPAFDQCGTCTLCIDACPTRAIVAPGVLDSTRCISYLTIELEGRHARRRCAPAIGTHVYGCDICQEVCPWNGTRRRVRGSGVAAASSLGRGERPGDVRPIRRGAAGGDAWQRDAAYEGRRPPEEPRRGATGRGRVTR